jgi:hypothetical protein
LINTIVESVLAPLQAAAASPLSAPVRIRSVAMQKRGPDGRQRGEGVYLDYSRVHVDSDGQVSGGTVAVQSKFNNAVTAGSQVRFGQDGRAVGGSTTQYDRFAGGVYRTIETDLSGLRLLQGRIVDGSLAFHTRDNAGGMLHTGTLAFANERLSSADIEAAPATAGAAARRVHLDFSATRFLGSEIVGGTLAMQSRLSNGNLAAEAAFAFSAHGLPQGVSMKIYDDADGTLRGTMELDYADVAFNGLKEVDAGSLGVTARRPDGALACKGTLTYKGSLPSGYRAEAYDHRGTVQRLIAIDYSKAQFNQARLPINSSLTVTVTDPGNDLISTTVIDYGPQGRPIRRHTHVPARQPGGADTVSEVDCREAVYDARGAVVGGRTTTRATTGDTVVTVVRAFAGTRRCATKERTVAVAGSTTPRKWSKTYYRPDGTALKRATVNADSTGKPISGTVVGFATDGRTVVSKRTVDYTGLTYAGGAPSGGHIGLATKDGNGRARSSAVVRVG